MAMHDSDTLPILRIDLKATYIYAPHVSLPLYPSLDFAMGWFSWISKPKPYKKQRTKTNGTPYYVCTTCKTWFETKANLEHHFNSLKRGEVDATAPTDWRMGTARRMHTNW